jgi:hypothetical protein
MVDYFHAKKLLNKEITMLTDVPFNVNICAYTISNEILPFLNFIMVNEFNSFTFPYFFTPINSSIEEIREKILQCMSCHLQLNFNNDDYDKCIDGYFEYNNTCYVFLNMSLLINKLNFSDVFNNSYLCLLLMDEIVNTRHIFGIPVSNEVTNFFLSNKEFIFLVDENKDLVEIPTVAYTRELENRMLFVTMFGKSVKDKHAMFGPFHYFTDFENVMVNDLKTGDENEIVFGCEPLKTEKYGIIRFALFFGDMKIIKINDYNDSSEIKQERLKDVDCNQQVEGLTIKLSDHDGTWANEYDSCLLTKLTMENDKELKNVPIYVVKQYSQQIPLNYMKL